jgi:uncharacterized protein (TIGR02246 family)
MEPPVLGDTADHADLAAIEQIVADAEKAFNTNDPDLLTAPFAANASVVNAMGALLSGRDAIDGANRAGLAGFLRDEYVSYTVREVVFLRSDVAIAYKDARATTADGALLDTDPAMRALYVLVREGGRWWVAARQNTLVRT